MGTVKRPGAFTKKAKAAGMTVQQFAKKTLRKGSKADTGTKHQAVYAQNAKKVALKHAKKK